MAALSQALHAGAVPWPNLFLSFFHFLEARLDMLICFCMSGMRYMVWGVVWAGSVLRGYLDISIGVGAVN